MKCKNNLLKKSKEVGYLTKIIFFDFSGAKANFINLGFGLVCEDFSAARVFIYLLNSIRMDMLIFPEIRLLGEKRSS